MTHPNEAPVYGVSVLWRTGHWVIFELGGNRHLTKQGTWASDGLSEANSWPTEADAFAFVRSISPPASEVQHDHKPSAADIDDCYVDDGSLDTPEVAAQIAAMPPPPALPATLAELPTEPGFWNREGVRWFIEFGIPQYDTDYQLLGGHFIEDGKSQYRNAFHVPKGGWSKATADASGYLSDFKESQIALKAEQDKVATLTAELKTAREERDAANELANSRWREMFKIKAAVKSPDLLFASQLECAAADKVRDLQAKLTASEARVKELTALVAERPKVSE